MELDLEEVPRLVSVKPTSLSNVNGVEQETQLVTVAFDGGGPASPPAKPDPAVLELDTGPEAARSKGGPAWEAKGRKISADLENSNQRAACPPQSSKARPTLTFLRDIKNRGAAEAATSPSGPPELPFLVDIRNRNPSKFSHLVDEGWKRSGTPENQQQQHLPFLKEITRNRHRRTVQVRQGKQNATTSKTEGQGNRNSATALQLSMATFEASAGSPMDLDPTATAGQDTNQELKRGNLTKSSQHRRKEGARPGPKQKRKFRLTSEALEYFQPFSHVKLRRSYPLISVESIEYNKRENPLHFKMVFPNYFLFLQADSQQETQDWVDHIISAWSKWKTPGLPNSDPQLAEGDMDLCPIEDGEDVEEDDTFAAKDVGDTYLDIIEPLSPDDTGLQYDPNKDVCPVELPELPLAPVLPVVRIPPPDGAGYSPPPDGAGYSPPPGAAPSPDTVFSPGAAPTPVKTFPSICPDPMPTISEEAPEVPKEHRRFNPTPQSHRPRTQSSDDAYLHKKSPVDATFNSRQKRLTKRAFRLAKLKPPSLERTPVIYDPEQDYGNELEDLHGHASMIKYPNSFFTLPSEKLFVVDRDNLVLMWRNNSSNRFSLKNSLSLRRVVEIRQGQETVKFDQFPYDQVIDKSFSLLFESESNKFAKLDSLDIICEAVDVYSGWMKGLELLVTSSQWLHLYPPRYEDSDPAILWLKQMWWLKCESDMEEMKQQDAIKMVCTFLPIISKQQARIAVASAHFHQLTPTVNRGLALRWDGFVLMFNILCHTNNLQLYDIYLKYAKSYPFLGLTMKEFKEFLIEECYWSAEDCKVSLLLTMMKNYDEHHQAVKKYDAKNKPNDFQKAAKLLSFRGLLSFLRSKNNSIINLEHETVYQDMTQPLSHYFINSSHNTYLEGDQLTGTSSMDAYVRCLLQGCRCVEIDCWDDTRNTNGLAEKEPIIYHGHTLTTRIPFRNVIHTINDYGFHSSIYPVIISIENHCSSSQQAVMAQIFRVVFADRLPQENLVEKDSRERLPSPLELQGKVILKGSFSKEEKAKQPKLPTKINKKMRSQTSSDSKPNQDKAVPGKVVSPLTRSQEVQRQATKELRKMDTIIADDQTDGLIRSNRPGSIRRRNLEGYLIQKNQGQDDQELTFTRTGTILSDLIVYCRSISIKPWSWMKQKKSAVCEMFSFGEPTINELSKRFPKELLSCSERQLVRSYPRGTRFDSSNYDPMPLWACGVQMVSLNFQKPDLCMHLNQGFFRNNGGCGYVLKPSVMRCQDPGKARYPYTPDIDSPHPDVPTISLEIELLSGQRLSLLGKKCSYLTVDIMTFGVEHDNSRMKQATHNYSFWPTWGEGEHVLKRTILMPELCLVYFKVDLEGRRIFGQNCFPLVSLNSGIKFVPMRTNGGELLPESGLFVRIKKIVGSRTPPTSPNSGGVKSSLQLPVNPMSSLPSNATYFRSRFAATHDEEMNLDDGQVLEALDVVSDSETSETSQRRVSSPAVMKKHRSQENASPALGKMGTSTCSNGSVEVEVHVCQPRENKSQSFN